MVTVELSGGLGNQMFQYALAVKLQYIGRDVCINPSFSSSSNRRYELDLFENIKSQGILTRDEKNVSPFFTKKLIRRVKSLFGLRELTYNDRIIEYQPRVFEYDNVYLSGYWQNEKYFKDIREIILRCFSFDRESIVCWTKLLKEKYGEFKPENENSISVHIRRTDYDLPQYEPIYGNICTIDYYQRAIYAMADRVESPIFYYFSDDIGWVKDNLLTHSDIEPHTYRVIDVNCKDAAMDMWIMTRCRHHIIANSTYSWWGAWLGTNNDKIVMAPQKWMNGYSDDIICQDWIKI